MGSTKKKLIDSDNPLFLDGVPQRILNQLERFDGDDEPSFWNVMRWALRHEHTGVMMFAVLRLVSISFENEEVDDVETISPLEAHWRFADALLTVIGDSDEAGELGADESVAWMRYEIKRKYGTAKRPWSVSGRRIRGRFGAVRSGYLTMMMRLISSFHVVAGVRESTPRHARRPSHPYEAESARPYVEALEENR